MDTSRNTESEAAANLSVGERIVNQIVKRAGAGPAGPGLRTGRPGMLLPFEDQAQRVILADPAGRAALAKTISSAIATLTSQSSSVAIQPNDRPRSDGGDEGGGGGGGGTAPNVEVNLLWWGVQVVFPEPTVRYLLGIAGIEGALLGALGLLPAFAAVPWLIPVLAAYIAVQAILIGLVDQGNGVYLSMLWVAPGIFVPTSI